MRIVIQSLITGCFLCPGEDGGTVQWVRSLRDAGPGIFTDTESAAQVFEDWTDWEDGAVVVDLDRLGTINDYPRI